MPGSHGKGTDIIRLAAFNWCNKIRQTKIWRAIFALRHLLAQTTKTGQLIFPALILKQNDIITVSIRRPKAGNTMGGELIAFDNFPEHFSRISIKRPRWFADNIVIENLGEAAGQFPGREKWRPINIICQFLKRIVFKATHAKEAWFMRRER